MAYFTSFKVKTDKRTVLDDFYIKHIHFKIVLEYDLTNIGSVTVKYSSSSANHFT